MTEFGDEFPGGLPDDFDAELNALVAAAAPDESTEEYRLSIDHTVGVIIGVLGGYNLVPDGLDLSGLTISQLTDLTNDPNDRTASFATRAIVLADRLWFRDVAAQYSAMEDAPVEDMVAESNYDLIALLARGDNPEVWLATAEQLVGDIGLPADPTDRQEVIDMAMAWVDINRSHENAEQTKLDNVKKMLGSRMDKLGYNRHDDSANLMNSMMSQIRCLHILEKSRPPGLDHDQVKQRIDNDEMVQLNREGIERYSQRIGANPAKINLLINMLTTLLLIGDRTDH